MKEFTISKQNEGQRFDKYLFRILGNSSMSFVFKMLRKKNFVLNDKRATGKEILKAGDIVKIYLSDETFDKFKTPDKLSDSSFEKSKKTSSFDLKKNIIYEDKDIILINKPYNMLSQKAEKDDVSINEYIIEYLVNTGKIDNNSLTYFKPSCVNRLDRNTTGIIIAAKTLKAAQVLSEALKNRTIEKYYKCLVYGEFAANGSYKAYLTKDNASNKVSITDNKLSDDSNYIETAYKLIKFDNDLSEVEVHLITGKSHQIRAHIAYLGFPIIGDKKYGNKSVNDKYKAKHQLLHAYKIVFPDFKSTDFEFSGKTFICDPVFRY